MLKIVILCGGRGKRLSPLTADKPKALIELNRKPILQHLIDFYIKNGFQNFILCTGYRSGVIEDFIQSKKFNAEIEISNVGVEAGILKRLYGICHLIDEKIIVTYGDTFIDIDIPKILSEHCLNGSKATITIADIQSPFGIISIKNNKVISFQEKPIFSYYIGHMVLERTVIESLDKRLIDLPDGEGLIQLFQQLIKTSDLNAYDHKGLQLTFNTLHEYQKAEEEFIKFYTE